MQPSGVEKADDYGGKAGGEVGMGTGKGRTDGSRGGSLREALAHEAKKVPNTASGQAGLHDRVG